MRAFVVIYTLPTGRFHPCWYSERPFPGTPPDTAWRFQSRGHHTSGCNTFAQAQEAARELGAAINAGMCACPPEHVVLDKLYRVDDPIGMVITPAFGQGYPMTLQEALQGTLGLGEEVPLVVPANG